MSGNIRLSREHGVAPALMFCRICGKETNGIAMLGASCNKVMREVCEATGGREGSKNGYKEYGHNRVPDSEPCAECKSYLDNGGCIIIADDKGEYLRLDKNMLDSLIGRVVVPGKGAIDFERMRGKVCRLNHAFWYSDEEGNVRLRDPKEWA